MHEMHAQVLPLLNNVAVTVDFLLPAVEARRSLRRGQENYNRTAFIVARFFSAAGGASRLSG
jgi:hypothetical protein